MKFIDFIPSHENAGKIISSDSSIFYFLDNYRKIFIYVMFYEQTVQTFLPDLSKLPKFHKFRRR